MSENYLFVGIKENQIKYLKKSCDELSESVDQITAKQEKIWLRINDLEKEIESYQSPKDFKIKKLRMLNGELGKKMDELVKQQRIHAKEIRANADEISQLLCEEDKIIDGAFSLPT